MIKASKGDHQLCVIFIVLNQDTCLGSVCDETNQRNTHRQGFLCQASTDFTHFFISLISCTSVQISE